MRSKKNAAVDKYGADFLADMTEEPKIYRFQVLVGCMLSARTRDKVFYLLNSVLMMHFII